MNKTLHIIRGVPGAGKSTLAHQVCADVFEADDYFTRDGVYKYVVEEIADAHRSCEIRVKHAMMNGITPICVSNTFTRRWEMRSYKKLAETHGYEVKIHVVNPGLSAEQLAERNAHGVTADKIQAMIDRWED